MCKFSRHQNMSYIFSYSNLLKIKSSVCVASSGLLTMARRSEAQAGCTLPGSPFSFS
jgi:hypothetical protein